MMESYRILVEVEGMDIPPSPVMSNPLLLVAGLEDLIDILLMAKREGKYFSAHLETTDASGNVRTSLLYDSKNPTAAIEMSALRNAPTPRFLM